MQIAPNSTDVSISFRALDSSGDPVENLTHQSAGLNLWYAREGNAKIPITAVALSGPAAAHVDGGLIHIDDGWYRLDVPDAAFASGSLYVTIGGDVTGATILTAPISLPAPASTVAASAAASQMVTNIETALLNNEAGLVRVTVDGVTTEWDRDSAIRELEYWRRQATAGNRPRAASIDLSSA